jgi:UDP-glucoronosyl and UDP-glucosyl transferase
MVRSRGFAFHRGGEPPEEYVGPIRERLPVAPPDEASILGNRELFGRLATTAMLPEAERALRDYSPDLVLRDPCEYASAIVAADRGIAVAQVAISLADAEDGSISVAAPALEDHKQGLAAELRRHPYVTRFPRSLDPSPFPETLRYKEMAPPRPGPLPDWWNGSAAPLIYMTFGTVLGYMSVAADVFRMAVKAVEKLRVRVLLTVGRHFEVSKIGDLPAHVHVEPWLDQAQILPYADLVVCHGGSGTALGAVAAGVPLVIVPVFADQFENGRRLGAAGAAGVVGAGSDQTSGARHPIREIEASRLSEAVRGVLEDPGYREAARRIAQEMNEAVPPGEALTRLLGGSDPLVGGSDPLLGGSDPGPSSR